jgi:hypothetical protein
MDWSLCRRNRKPVNLQAKLIANIAAAHYRTGHECEKSLKDN